MDVTLESLSHTSPDDIDALLVGPRGQSVVLMSDAGGGSDLHLLRLGFFDAAPPLPDSTPPSESTYRPTNYGAGDAFPSPAPATASGASLSVFNGSNPNGSWRLYINDDAAGGTGQLDAWDFSIASAPDPGRCANPFRLTNGNNIFFGGRGGDRILARGGNDRVVGLSGDDCLSGGSGRDLLKAGIGDDAASGNSGRDRI